MRRPAAPGGEIRAPKAKLNEMSSQGWELAFVTSGVESADQERDAIFITRYHFQKEK